MSSLYDELQGQVESLGNQLIEAEKVLEMFARSYPGAIAYYKAYLDEWYTEETSNG